jgi:hypothetical protein
MPEVDLEIGAAVGIGKRAEIPVSGSRPRLDWPISRATTVQATFNNSLAQGNNPATTYTFMSFPQVTPNKIWAVLRIGVTAPDPFTVLAGVSVLAFRSSTVPQDSNAEPPTFGDLIGVLGQVPNTLYPVSPRTITARGNERVVLAFKGLANAQQIQASMDVIEHDLQAYLQSLMST